MKYRFIVLLVYGTLLKAGVVGSLIVDDEFISHYTVSKMLKEKLDTHATELGRLLDKVHATERQKHGVWKFDWLPGYYVKYNVSRVIKRDLLARCIQEENLHLMHTPEKYLYHIKGRPTEFNSLNYAVICKEVHDSKREYQKPMDLEQVMQFICIIEKTGHLSTFEHNFLRLSDRRVSFIDTDGSFNTAKPNTGFVRLVDRDLAHYYTKDALDYIIDKIAKQFAQETDTYRKNKCLSDLKVFTSRQGALGEKVAHAIHARTKYYKESNNEEKL